jgi:hypothetical protein
MVLIRARRLRRKVSICLRVNVRRDAKVCVRVSVVPRHVMRRNPAFERVTSEPNVCVEIGSMPKVFSRRTLGEFEAASASIPLRQIDRVFEAAGIPLGQDPGGSAGERRAQFRRYVAGLDRSDRQQSSLLGDALGALIAEVAVSKQDFLVRAAERDGFYFADGVFRPVEIAPRSFAVARVEDMALIEDHGRRLRLLANDSPEDAIGGANELVESVCRTVLRFLGKPEPGKTADLADIAVSTLGPLEVLPASFDDAKEGADVVRKCLQQLGAVVAIPGERQNLHGSGDECDGKWKGLSPRHARLAVGAAVTFAGFVAETYVEWAARKNV